MHHSATSTKYLPFTMPSSSIPEPQSQSIAQPTPNFRLGKLQRWVTNLENFIKEYSSNSTSYAPQSSLRQTNGAPSQSPSRIVTQNAFTNATSADGTTSADEARVVGRASINHTTSPSEEPNGQFRLETSALGNHKGSGDAEALLHIGAQFYGIKMQVKGQQLTEALALCASSRSVPTTFPHETHRTPLRRDEDSEGILESRS